MNAAERSRAWAIANPEKAKAKAKRWYLINSDKVKAASLAWAKANPEKHNAKSKRWRKNNFFKCRAKTAVSRNKQRTMSSVASDIFWLWHKQRGRCALTGKRLDRTAELDHIIPISKGGTNERSNLQWLSPEVNQCKNDLTDQEFIAICKAVLSHKL